MFSLKPAFFNEQAEACSPKNYSRRTVYRLTCKNVLVFDENILFQMPSSGPPLQQMTNSILSTVFTQTAKMHKQVFVAPNVEYITPYYIDNTLCRGAGTVCHLVLREVIQKIPFCSISFLPLPILNQKKINNNNNNLFNL